MNYTIIIAMEPDKLEVCVALKEQCKHIVTESYPHYKEMYPCGVKEMTVLYPELSEEALAVKIRQFKEILQ